MGIGLQISLERVDQKIILRLNGRIDASSAPLLEKKLDCLIEEDLYFLILDFTRVHYLSSAGMRVLLSTSKKLASKNGYLLLFSIGDDVFEIIKMAGFDKILHIFSSEEDALQFHKK